MNYNHVEKPATEKALISIVLPYGRHRINNLSRVVNVMFPLNVYLLTGEMNGDGTEVCS